MTGNERGKRSFRYNERPLMDRGVCRCGGMSIVEQGWLLVGAETGGISSAR